MNTPKNCRECEHNATCEKSYYGGGLCKYKAVIEEKTVSRARGTHQK